jgi:hypothetical protein
MRDVARATAPSLPRGRYLVRVAPGAADAAPERFRTDVANALRRAGRSGQAAA